ncbi:MAG TPA: hypothetical protein VJ739_03075 [Gemmataceae bacterium]|nr:hypothetical protein [Gemmataceae bacterium]
MKSSTLATNLVGRPVRLRERRPDCPADTGQIATIFIDEQGMHYVLLVGGRLVQVDDPAAFTVLDDTRT